MIGVSLAHKITRSYAYGHIALTESGDELVTLDDWFIVEPFWLDKDKLARDVEGKYYWSYIKEHRGFKLVVRRGVLERLLKAKNFLPKEWTLVIKAGFRPMEVQQAMFDAFLADVHREHDEWSDEECKKYAGQYVSDPNIGAPAHTTGGAIDIDVLDQSAGTLVDMGCKICDLGEASHCLNSKLTVEQRDNQEVLLHAMCKAGFAPLSSEWWHFSYGDQRWAAFYNKAAAIYDTAKMITIKHKEN